MNHKLHKESGLSLIELMISIAIGAVLMIGLVSSFKNSSDTKRELERAGQLIENGRYATDLLSNDVRLAGFYGAYFTLGDPPDPLADPCLRPATQNASDLAAFVAFSENAMNDPIQGYNAASISAIPDISATTCGTYLTNNNLQAGSDILVIRRASSVVYKDMDKDGDNTIDANYDQDVFLVANANLAGLKIANTGTDIETDTSWNTIDGQVRKLLDNETSPANFPSDWPFAKLQNQPNLPETRKYIVHVYFVAPCNYGNGPNGDCTGTEPDRNNIPTLKVLELKSVSNTTTMVITPLVEGIEYFKVEYGIDDTPTAKNLVTGYTGDGIPDNYSVTPATADWQKVVSVKIYLISRTLTKFRGYSDQKSFVLGTTLNVPAAGDAYRRNLFTAEIRPTNMAGRREIPE